MKVEKDDVGRYIHVLKELAAKDDKKCDGDRKLVVYRVFMKDYENSQSVVESCRKRHNFPETFATE